MKRIGSLLIVAALVAATVGCVAPPTEYNLTISSTEGGEITSLGEGTFTCEEGEVVNLIATPASGYRFVRWTGDVDTIEDVEAPSTTITVKGNYSIIAIFEAISAGRYTLTVSSSAGGSVTAPGEGTFTYDAGTVVSLVAMPTCGYQFVNWTGNADSIEDFNAPLTTITMNDNYSIRANFIAIPPPRYTLTISSTAGGSVITPGEGTFTYHAGTTVSLVAMPATGYHFVGWTGDVGAIANINAASTTITMNGSCSIRADFSVDSPSPPGIGYTEAQAEALIIILVNDQRQQFGLPALSEDPLLAGLAKEHPRSVDLIVSSNTD